MSKSTAATPFILETAQNNQLSIDETLLDNCLELRQTPPDPFEERRGVDIDIHSDNSVKASSFKAYNLLFFSQNKFQMSLMKVLPVAAGIASGSTVVATVLALCTFLAEFMERGTKEFNEQDAKVLLAIYKLGSYCHISTIPAEYKRLFNTSVSEETVRNSINLLARYRTVRLYNNGEVEIKETVQLTRQ